MTDKPKYEAGDVVKIKLGRIDALHLNDGDFTRIAPDQIISHTPAPEPIVGYVNVYPNGFGYLYDFAENTFRIGDGERIATLKLTYDRATGEALAEVVK